MMANGLCAIRARIQPGGSLGDAEDEVRVHERENAAAVADADADPWDWYGRRWIVTVLPSRYVKVSARTSGPKYSGG